MEIQTDTVNESRLKINVTLSASEVTLEERTILNQFAGKASIAGFRPGKAPVHMVKGKYKKAISEELERVLVSKAYEKISKDTEHDVYRVVDLDTPKIEKSSDVTLTFSVDLQPKFETPEYTGIDIHKHGEDVTDEEIDKIIDNVRDQRADYQTVEREAQKGDYVKLSYEGKIGEEAVADLVPDKPMYGKQSVTWEEAGAEDTPGVAAIVQGIVGMKAGDEKTVTESFKKDAEVEALQGKKVTYTVEVQEVREKVLPELNEEFLKSLEVESEEDLRTRIKESLQKDKADKNHTHMREQIINALSEKVEFPIPESAVESESHDILNTYVQRQLQSGVPESALEGQLEELLSGAKEAATKQVKANFIIAEIAKKEKLEVKNEDLQKRIMQEAIATRTRPEKLVKELQKDQQKIAKIRESVLFHKTLDFLVDSANVSLAEEGIECCTHSS